MGRAVHDYHLLEREYLNEPELSIRELCKRHNIKSWSAVSLYAKKNGWLERRQAIKERTEEKVIEAVSTRVADIETDLLMTYRDEAVSAVREAIARFREQLKDESYKIHPDALLKLMNAGLLLLGQPTSRTEERKLELSGTIEGLPPEVLRRLVEVARPPAKPVGPAAQSSTETTRSN